jgi:hypothetical protein
MHRAISTSRVWVVDHPPLADRVSVTAVGEASRLEASPEPDVVVHAPVVGSQTTVDPDPEPEPEPDLAPPAAAAAAAADFADDEPAPFEPPADALTGVEVDAAPPVP